MSTIIGNAYGELLTGTGDADVIYPEGGVDNVQAGDGDDEIVLRVPLGAGSTINGGAGIDTLVLQPQPTYPYLVGGTLTQYNAYFPTAISSLEKVRFESRLGDFLSLVVVEVQRSSAGLTTLIGGAGRDVFYDVVFTPGTYTMPALIFENWNSDLRDRDGSDFVVLIVSGGGNYVLNAREGLASIQGLISGSGNDVLNGSSGSDALNGGAGIDQLYGNGGNDILYAENVTPYGGVASQRTFAGSLFAGGGGEDALVIGGRVDFQGTLVGIENVVLQKAVTALPGSTGLDSAYLILSGTNAHTLASNARIIGTGTLQIDLGVVTAFDASGYQFEPAEFVSLVINGSLSDDFVVGTLRGDTLNGDAGNDELRGGAGDDFLFGSLGNDTLRGDAGNDYLDGGAGGLDTLVYTYDDLASEMGIVDLRYLTSGSHAVRDGRGGIDTVTGFERLALFGTPGGESLWGATALANFLSGMGGDDLLIGGNLDDTLDGGAGNDYLSGHGGRNLLIGGSGQDSLNGGLGIDTIDYSASPAGVQINLASGRARGGDAEGDSFSNIDNVVGSSLGDVLTGNKLVNLLAGGAGNDTLDGGGGADELWGGSGADLFQFKAIADIGAGAIHDRIMDFEGRAPGGAAIDRIDLSAIDAITRTTLKNDSFTFIGSALFSGKAGELRVDYTSATHAEVKGDTNGDGVADFTLGVDFTGILDANAFVL